MKLVMVGHYAGKTVVINGHKFVDGVLELQGDLKDMDGLVRYFRTFNAHLAGSTELEMAQAQEASNGSGAAVSAKGGAKGGVSSDKSGSSKEPNGAGHDGASSTGPGSLPNGDGVPAGRDSGAPVSTDPEALKIREALMKLDPENDDNWTDAGLAKVSVIEDITGIVGVLRKDIDAVLPGWSRDKAIEKKLSEI